MASAGGETVVLFKSVFTDEYVRPIVTTQPTNEPIRLLADGQGVPQMSLLKTGNGCHIKSLETKKYWQVKSGSESDSWITADADAISDNNTLFDIEYFVAPATTATTTTLRLRHHFLQNYACLYKENEDYAYRLRAFNKIIDKDSKDVFVCEKSE